MKRPYRSDLIKRLHEKIHEEFLKDRNYTFTCADFNDLAKTEAEKRNIRCDLWRRSTMGRADAQLFKIVGERPAWRRPLTVYAPIRSHLPRISGATHRKFEMQLTEKDELILDREHRREAEETPAPVLEVHNILFNLGVRK